MMDAEVEKELRKVLGWREVLLQKRILEAQQAQADGEENEAIAAYSSSLASQEPSSSSCSSSSFSPPPSERAFPSFFINAKAAKDPVLKLFRTYRDVLTVIDPGDLIAAAKIGASGALCNDPVLTHYVSVFFKDPFMAEELGPLLITFWAGGFWEEGDEAKQLPPGVRYRVGAYPSVELLRLIYTAVENSRFQELSHELYFQRSTSYTLLLALNFYEIDGSADAAAIIDAAATIGSHEPPPLGVFFNDPSGAVGRRLYRRTPKPALQQIRRLRGVLAGMDLPFGVVRGEAVLKQMAKLKALRAGSRQEMMSLPKKEHKMTQFGVPYDPSETPYTLLNKGRVDAYMRVGKDVDGNLLPLSAIQWGDKTVEDLVPFCPDEKKCLLLFKQCTPVWKIERHYGGLSIFLLVCHYCQTSKGDAARWIGREEGLPEVNEVLKAVDNYNRRTLFNPKFSTVMAILAGEERYPEEATGTGIHRAPRSPHFGDRSGLSTARAKVEARVAKKASKKRHKEAEKEKEKQGGGKKKKKE